MKRFTTQSCWRALMILTFLTLAQAAFAAPEAASQQSGPFQWFPFLAPFHSVILHLPIGFVMMAFILDVYSLFRPSPELRRAITLVLICCALSAVLTIALGLLRAHGGGYDPKALSLHQSFGIAVGFITILALAAHRFAFHDNPEGRQLPLLAYRLLLLGNLVTLAIAGHLGGNLTYGSQYLVENAPKFVKEMFDSGKTAEADSAPLPLNDGAEALSEQEQFYADVVLPIFDAKCRKCHGTEKKKGDYTLYDPEVALKGGESGEPGIVPGKPGESQLVKLILLPEDDDNVMPPSGKERLTYQEIGAIVKWISDGATFPAK